MRFATASIALVASASSAMAVGSAIIINNCPYDVIVNSVSDVAGPDNKLSANGGKYSEQFRENPNLGGISLKVSKPGQSGLVSQFEYTYNPPSNPFPGVFWDLSLIDGNVFKDTSVALIPKILSGNPGGSCTKVLCTGGAACKDAYNQPWENDATRQCPADTDLTYHLCSDGDSQPASSPAPASTPAAAPAASPAPVASPAPAAAAPSPVVLKADPSPAPAASPAPAPAAPKVPSWAVGFAVGQEGQPLGVHQINGKREAHANHMERHHRIRRMHHARTVA